MKCLRNYVAHSRVLTVALIVSVIAVVYGFERYDFNFLDNLIATSVGVLFGLVLGLFTISLELSDQRTEAEKQAALYAREILKRIQTELEYNFKITDEERALLPIVSGDVKAALDKIARARLAEDGRRRTERVIGEREEFGTRKQKGHENRERKT